MMFVTERNGLITNNVLFRYVRRADDTAPSKCYGNDHDKAAEDREARDRICRPVKDLRHFMTTEWQLFTSMFKPQIARMAQI